MSSDSSSDASYVPTSDVDYYSDDSDLVHDAEGVSEEEIVPDGEEDPEGFTTICMISIMQHLEILSSYHSNIHIRVF